MGLGKSGVNEKGLLGFAAPKWRSAGEAFSAANTESQGGVVHRRYNKPRLGPQRID